MYKFIAAALFTLAAIQPGLAETCEETFARLMIHGNGDEPVKIHVVQDIKGGSVSTNEFLMVKRGHWMTKMIDPASGWFLTYDNVMYQSNDEGQTWSKVRDVDSEQDHKTSIENLTANATTIQNAVCGEADLDGVMHDTVEADFETLQNFKTQNHYRYWVNRETSYIAKAVYEMKGEGFESVTTQTLEKAPELTLPTPE